MEFKGYFTDIGIDAFGFYTPKFFIDVEDLARSRNVEPKKFKEGLLLKEMRIPDYGEDIVTMGLEACQKALINGNIKSEEIDALFVGTETMTYAVKSVSNILAEILKISPNSFTQDIYNACAGASLAIINAIGLIDKGIIKKALIVGADICYYKLNSPGEPTQGAGAFALVITKNPRLACFSEKFGKISGNVNDFFRNIGRDVPTVFGKYSIDSYLNFQMGAFKDLIKKTGDFIADYYVFHAPFSKLPIKFMQQLVIEKSELFINHILKIETKQPKFRLFNDVPSIRRNLKQFPSLIVETLKNIGFSVEMNDEILKKFISFSNSVLPHLNVSRYFGNMYSASVWAQIIYILENSAKNGEILYFGSYGSGATCIAGLLKVMPNINYIHEQIPQMNYYFENKIKKTIKEYEDLRKASKKPEFKIGLIREHEKNDGKGYELHYCDEECLIPNKSGIDHCPQGHSGFHKIFFPLYAILDSEPEKLKEYNSSIFVKDKYVRIFNTSKKGTTLEFNLRRSLNKIENETINGTILNWNPVYAPNGPIIY